MTLGEKTKASFMFEQLTAPSLWQELSKKAKDKVLSPFNQGSFPPQEYERQGHRLVTGEAGSFGQGAKVRWHWLVDTSDGILVDVRYECFGPSALIAALEVTSEMILSKAYDRALSLQSSEIERQLRDREQEPALPHEAGPYLNLILEALDLAAQSASDIPIAHPIVSPLPSSDLPPGEPRYPQWLELSLKERLSIVREVLEKEVRPYVELDQGGVEALDLVDDFKVIIVYSGACDGCFASTGSTLASIQAILRAQIHPDLRVEPQL